MVHRESNDEVGQRRRILLVAAASLLLLVVGAAIVVIYDVGGLRTRAVSNAGEAYGDVVFRTMRETCVKGANDSVRASGGDPAAPDVANKLAAYCDCFVADVRAQFTVAEIAKLEETPDQITSDPRMKAIIDRCVAQHLGS